MTKMTADTFDCPTWALNAIINGDYTGLSEEDIKLVVQFMSAYGPLAVFFSVDEEPEGSFCKSPEFGLHTTCVELAVWIPELTE